jgi:hypothetical protein
MATLTDLMTGVSLNTVNCANCTIRFGVTPEFEKEHRESGTTFYCPVGHPLHWSKTPKPDVARLEREKEELRRLLAMSRETAQRERKRREEVQRALIGQRGATTRVRNKLKRIETRVAAGVCPKCNRTFSQLARHMKSQHPDGCEGHGDA